MRRKLIGLTLLGVLAAGGALVFTGCDESTPEDEAMRQRREPPANPRPAPGTTIGGPGGEAGGDNSPPPPTSDD